jgi:hypothetical protein
MTSKIGKSDLNSAIPAACWIYGDDFLCVFFSNCNDEVKEDDLA